MSEFSFNNDGDVNGKHFGDIIINSDGSGIVKFEQDGLEETVNKSPVTTTIAILILDAIASFSGLWTVFPDGVRKWLPSVIPAICLLVLAANFDIVRTLFRFNRRAIRAGNRVVTRTKSGQLTRAKFRAQCIYPECTGELRLTSPDVFRDGLLEAECTECPLEHQYTVDQNLVAIPKQKVYVGKR